MISDKDSVLVKIRKLMELSKSNNAHEASLAATRAQELMLRHRIQQAELIGDQEEKEEITKSQIHSDKQKRSLWKSSLADAIAKGFQCRVYLSGVNIIVIGRKSDIDTVQYLHQYLMKELQRLADIEFSKVRRIGDLTHGKTWKNNFYYGAVSAIRDRLKIQRDDIMKTASNQAITVITRDVARVEAVYNNLRLGKPLTYKAARHATARQVGYDVGKSVELGARGSGLKSRGKLLTS